jgi:hypothetical protein
VKSYGRSLHHGATFFAFRLFAITMSSDLFLRRKLTLRTAGDQVVFVKRPMESIEHVIMKALLWALYAEEYPQRSVEIRIGDRYKPDVVSLDGTDNPVFWAEAGKVGEAKIRSLARRFPSTHFAMGKWDTALEPYAAIIRDACSQAKRRAPFDLIRFPSDSVARFITNDRDVAIDRSDVEIIRIGCDF